MATDFNASRRRFLLGRRPENGRPVRPPWALAEELFTDVCNRCMACAEACPQGILVQGADGYPEADFTERGCTFCGECVTACKPAALVRGVGDGAWRPWPHRAIVGERCIAKSGTVCRTCADACNHGAIRVTLMQGGRASPEISAADCTGCGSCRAVCPVQAIALAPVPTTGTAMP